MSDESDLGFGINANPVTSGYSNALAQNVKYDRQTLKWFLVRALWGAGKSSCRMQPGTSSDYPTVRREAASVTKSQISASGSRLVQDPAQTGAAKKKRKNAF